MDELIIRKAHVLAKRLYVLLTETRDISKQLAEALDRNDQVTARMLIGMRSEPITKAQQTRAALGALRDGLSVQDAARLTELLNGAEPRTEQEQPLSMQLRSNENLMRQLLALDEGLNLKVARDKSIYQSKRTSAR